jgi:leucyl aminopeptidase
MQTGHSAFSPPELPLADMSLADALAVYLVASGGLGDLPDGAPVNAASWAAASGFSGKRGSLCLVPSPQGGIACALYGLGDGGEPMEAGRLARLLPPGDWRIEPESGLASLGFLLGAYRYSRYRKPNPAGPRLVTGDDAGRQRLVSAAAAMWMGRDLVNTPASDLGPRELEEAIRALAAARGASVVSVVGDALLEQRFPMVHAVGRASDRAPRIVDLRWGSEAHAKVTLVGKGVCFDSGGLNIKPGDSMTLMKKDMGGSASVLALAAMIMDARLPVRLRVIVPAVENSISGSAFRPGDVLQSRLGKTVEIGNTDAEGRLILADALAWADEEDPELLVDMATLTGAARVALGPDLPAFYCDDDAFAAEMAAAGASVQDPCWRMPLWKGYREGLSSHVADLSHIGKGPMGGSITAALFLQHFVSRAAVWAHLDVYAWTMAEKPWAPVGAEVQCARALFEVICSRYPAA